MTFVKDKWIAMKFDDQNNNRWEKVLLGIVTPFDGMDNNSKEVAMRGLGILNANKFRYVGTKEEVWAKVMELKNFGWRSKMRKAKEEDMDGEPQGI